MRAISVQAPARAGPRRSKRLLALARDDRLVEQIRRGNEAAFEVVFERYGRGILSFCRHMLGSQEEAEDAVQQTFASAHRAMLGDEERELKLKPWLYTIARNRCLSMLRARQEQLHVASEPATSGLAEQVEQRAELRDLLRDIGELPAEQRAALLLAEISDLPHAEIAKVLDCEVPRVKALVFRARSSLIARRDARDTPCEVIREQLAVLSGGSLRRTGIRHHLNGCSECRAYRDELRRQRQMLALALPVTPSLLLKSKVVATTGLGGGAAGGASMAGVGAGAASVGSTVVAKVAVLAVLAGGGAVGTQAVIGDQGGQPSPIKALTPGAGHRASESSGTPIGIAERGSSAKARAAESSAADAGSEHGKTALEHGHQGGKLGRGPADVRGSRGIGAERRSTHAQGVPGERRAPTTPPTHTPEQRAPVVKEHPVLPIPQPRTEATPRPDAVVPQTPGSAGSRRPTL